VLAALAVLWLGTTAAVAQSGAPTATLLTSGLEGTVGSTIGPDRALYVTEGTAGRISRVDPKTGAVTTFASGLPTAIFAFGGPVDVAFLDETAYVLVTLVGLDVGGSAVDGIYRVDGPNTFSVVADIGAWSAAHPPTIPFDYFVKTGVQYALHPYHGGFLVTDGHLNRVLHVGLDGTISEFYAFGDIVPTGLTVRGGKVYMAEAGPIPHLPADGKVVAFGPGSPDVTEVASGAPLLVAVEFGRGGTLYALSQGIWDGAFPGSPALRNTGALVKANGDGSFTVITDGLDRPTSLEFLGDTAYVVSLAGEIWKIDGVPR
jgi:hypothetical protein